MINKTTLILLLMCLCFSSLGCFRCPNDESRAGAYQEELSFLFEVKNEFGGPVFGFGGDFLHDEIKILDYVSEEEIQAGTFEFTLGSQFSLLHKVGIDAIDQMEEKKYLIQYDNVDNDTLTIGAKTTISDEKCQLVNVDLVYVEYNEERFYEEENPLENATLEVSLIKH